MLLYKFDDIHRGTVIKRPSQYCKTPYVADVEVLSSIDDENMCHSPSLGCCGLADKDSQVYLSKMTNENAKTQFRIEMSLLQDGENETMVGINPKLGEYIAENALKNDCILGLKHIISYERERTLLNSRFDFVGIDENNREFVMEVKNVPLADYVDVPKKERKKHLAEIEKKKYSEKIAYFPDGYRKNSTEVVSERALKHIKELQEIVETTNKRAILCFVVQRDDANCFQPSNIDLTYKKAVQDAWKKGVEIKTIQVCWNKKGECYFMRNNMPIHLFDYEGPHSLVD